jgi:hypothetical protein
MKTTQKGEYIGKTQGYRILCEKRKTSGAEKLLTAGYGEAAQEEQEITLQNFRNFFEKPIDNLLFIVYD